MIEDREYRIHIRKTMNLYTQYMNNKEDNMTENNETENKQDSSTLATFRCRLKTDRDGKDYFFAGGKKEPTMVDLSKCVVFIFEESDNDGSPIQKVVIREGTKHKQA